MMSLSRKEEKKQIEKLRKKGIGVSKTEDKFAEELRKRKLPYRRQVKIGAYRVDFFIPASIVVDIQGPHHDAFPQSGRDIKRLDYLRSVGYRVYVFSSSEVYQSPGKYARLIAVEFAKLNAEGKGSLPSE
jgi:very-short-patch-repair endonuclease